MKLELYRSPTGWRWQLSAKNNRIIGASTEGYTKRLGAIQNIHLVTGFVFGLKPDEKRADRIVRTI
jgi:uncharacterized protein YegP (UPF0339 family)